MPLSESSAPTEGLSTQTLNDIFRNQQIQLVKLDPKTMQPLPDQIPMIGSIVNLTVGHQGYLYHSAYRFSIAHELPGQPPYAHMISPPDSIIYRNGQWIIITKSNSVYRVDLFQLSEIKKAQPASWGEWFRAGITRLLAH